MKILIFVSLCLLACFADNVMISQPDHPDKHSCRWGICPYQGTVTAPGEWNETVWEYSDCTQETPCWLIDMLHLQHPEKNYDQLEELLTQYEKEADGDGAVLFDLVESSNYKDYKNEK